jgi:hypothetical protein
LDMGLLLFLPTVPITMKKLQRTGILSWAVHKTAEFDILDNNLGL